VPSIDCVYKLQEYAGLPRRKRSEKKATWPGRKQVWRRYDNNGRMAGDLLSLDAPSLSSPACGGGLGGGGEPLIHQVMQAGRRVQPSPPLDEIRRHAKRELERLPEALRQLVPDATYPGEVAEVLIKLANEVDSRLHNPSR